MYYALYIKKNRLIHIIYIILINFFFNNCIVFIISKNQFFILFYFIFDDIYSENELIVYMLLIKVNTFLKLNHPNLFFFFLNINKKHIITPINKLNFL